MGAVPTGELPCAAHGTPVRRRRHRPADLSGPPPSPARRPLRSHALSASRPARCGGYPARITATTCSSASSAAGSWRASAPPPPLPLGSEVRTPERRISDRRRPGRRFERSIAQPRGRLSAPRQGCRRSEAVRSHRAGSLPGGTRRYAPQSPARASHHNELHAVAPISPG